MNDIQLADATVLLRRFMPSDAPAVQALAGDQAVADTTLLIPHPYPPGAAEQWIATHDAQFEQQTGAVFAIIAQPEGVLVGAIRVGVNATYRHGELGYWIGRPFWGRGYATAAVRLVASYCFSQLDLHRVHAHHLARNPASGRVLQKAGMHREGLMREHVFEAGRYEDIVFYGMVRGDASGA